MTEWEPATEAEVAMRDALRANDQELYFRVLARTELLLPVSAEALAGRHRGLGHLDHRWPYPRAGLHLRRGAAGLPRRARRRQPAHPVRRSGRGWPNHEWWLAVNPGLPDRGLPAGLVRRPALPGRRPAARPRHGCPRPPGAGRDARPARAAQAARAGTPPGRPPVAAPAPSARSGPEPTAAGHRPGPPAPRPGPAHPLVAPTPPADHPARGAAPERPADLPGSTPWRPRPAPAAASRAAHRAPEGPADARRPPLAVDKRSPGRGGPGAAEPVVLRAGLRSRGRPPAGGAALGRAGGAAVPPRTRQPAVPPPPAARGAGTGGGDPPDPERPDRSGTDARPPAGRPRRRPTRAFTAPAGEPTRRLHGADRGSRPAPSRRRPRNRPTRSRCPPASRPTPSRRRPRNRPMPSGAPAGSPPGPSRCPEARPRRCCRRAGPARTPPGTSGPPPRSPAPSPGTAQTDRSRPRTSPRRCRAADPPEPVGPEPVADAEPVSGPPAPRRGFTPIVIEGTVIESRDLTGPPARAGPARRGDRLAVRAGPAPPGTGDRRQPPTPRRPRPPTPCGPPARRGPATPPLPGSDRVPAPGRSRSCRRRPATRPCPDPAVSRTDAAGCRRSGDADRVPGSDRVPRSDAAGRVVGARRRDGVPGPDAAGRVVGRRDGVSGPDRAPSEPGRPSARGPGIRRCRPASPRPHRRRTAATRRGTRPTSGVPDAGPAEDPVRRSPTSRSPLL